MPSMASSAFSTNFVPSVPVIFSPTRLSSNARTWNPRMPSLGRPVLRKVAGVPKSTDAFSLKSAENDGYGLPQEYYDDEWQSRQWEKTKEFEKKQEAEEEEEWLKESEYREIGSRLKGYPEEEVRKARILVSSFIRAGEEIEQKIEEAAHRGELTELILMVIWNRLDLAHRDEEKDAVRSLDLLYRRVEMEILKGEATAAMRLLNDLLNLHDGFDNEWIKKCRKTMIETFPREDDPFSMLVPMGVDINTQERSTFLRPESDDVLLRVDFVREVDALLSEVQKDQKEAQSVEGFDPESVAARLKHQEKQRTVHLIEAILDTAITLKW